MMADIEFEGTTIHVDARVIAQRLRLAPAAVHALMRDGKITSSCERGVDEDAGRYRLTFFHGNRRCRLIVDQSGDLIKSSMIDYGDRPLPNS